MLKSISAVFFSVVVLATNIVDGNPNSSISIKYLNASFFDEDYMSGRVWIENNSFYGNFTVWKNNVFMHVAILFCGQLQTKSRFVFRKAIKFCQLDNLKNVDDLIIRIMVLPFIKQYKFDYCPPKKVTQFCALLFFV